MFQNEADRDKFVASLSKARALVRAGAQVVAPEVLGVWRAFADLTNNADPLDVARFWLLHRPTAEGRTSVADAIKAFLTARQGLNLSPDSISHTRLHLRRFSACFRANLAALSAQGIRDWLASMQAAEYTKRHHYLTARLFLGWCVRERLLDHNPCDAVEVPTERAGDISVMPVGDAEKLFTANRDQSCIGRLALEAFGGLRYSSAQRISKTDITWKEQGLILSAAKHKSGRRHYLDGLPENLWAWLRHAPPACWEMEPSAYLLAKSACFIRAEIPHPHNVLRHSFASYHVALHKDAARTAVLLTHRSPTMLYRHYRGRASEADAKKYFAILP